MIILPFHRYRKFVPGFPRGQGDRRRDGRRGPTRKAGAGFRSCLLACVLPGGFLPSGESTAQDVEIVALPPAVEREGITGAGRAVVSGAGASRRVTLHYSTHPDDFGRSTGMGTAISLDGGRTWEAGADDWPLPDMVALWQDRLRDGTLLAFGIHWLPDPAKRRETTSAEVPDDAYLVGFSADGRKWETQPAVIEFPPELGVVARPLPDIFEDADGTLYMPAYSWGRTGNRSVLLRSEDGGRRWELHAVVTTAVAMIRAGAAVTTPWLETTVSPVSDGSWLAVIRTGSNEKSGLMSARSTNRGLTWSPVEPVLAGPEGESVAGKLPGLLLMHDGTLVLLTAHSRRGCFLHLSADGTGRRWSAGHLVTGSSGGNTSMVGLDESSLLVFSPANGRINCWRVTLGRADREAVPGKK